MSRTVLIRFALLSGILAGVLLAFLPLAHAEKHKGGGAKGAKHAAVPKPGGKSGRQIPHVVNTPVPKSAASKKVAGEEMNGDFGKFPTYIKSDSLTVKNKDRVFTYTGNVEVTHGDMILTSNSLEGNYDESNQIKDLTARENVVIVKGEDMRATGEQAVYDKATNTLVLTDNPELQQNGSVLTADKIRIYLQDNRSVAEGQVRVKLIKATDGTPTAQKPRAEKKPFGLDSLRD